MLLTVEDTGERIVARLGDIELWVAGRNAAGEPIPGIASVESFLPIAMILAAQRGESVEVAEAVSRSTAVRLNLDFGPLMQSFFELPVPPRFVAASIVPNKARPPAPGTGLLFSGGVDSFYSLMRLRQAGIPPTHFINVHAGSHDDNPATFTARVANVREVAAELGVDALSIDTNLHRVWRLSHELTHTIRNLTAVLCFRNLLGAAYYSSSNAFPAVSFAEARRLGLISLIEPLFIRAMVPNGFDAAVIGQDTPRIEKTVAVAGEEIVRRHLDICMDQDYQAKRSDPDPINCGRCLKCVRTLFTLERRAELHTFDRAFDLDAWQREREQRLQWLERNGGPAARADLVRLGRPSPNLPASGPLAPARRSATEELQGLRSELAAIRASRSFRVGNALAKAYRRLRGRPLD